MAPSTDLPDDGAPATVASTVATGPAAAAKGPGTSTDPAAAQPVSRRAWTGIAAVVVLLAVGVAVVLATREPAPLPGIARDPALTTAGLTFADHGTGDAGEPAGLAAAPGGVNLVYFGYLSCPDVCPTTMADIRAALDDVPPDLRADVAVTFVTVDPERDDPAAIRDYLGHFFESPTTIRALRADDPGALDDAAAQLGVIVEVEEHEPGDEDYDVAHSAITYIVDDEGMVVRELPFGAPPEDFTAVIEATVD